MAGYVWPLVSQIISHRFLVQLKHRELSFFLSTKEYGKKEIAGLPWMADHNGLAFTIFGRTMEPRSYDHLRAMNLLGVKIALGQKN